MKREDSTTKWIDAEDATRGCKYVVEVTGEGLDVAYFDHAGDWCIDGGDVSERISTRVLMIPPDDQLTLGRIFDHGDEQVARPSVAGGPRQRWDRRGAPRAADRLAAGRGFRKKKMPG